MGTVGNALYAPQHTCMPTHQGQLEAESTLFNLARFQLSQISRQEENKPTRARLRQKASVPIFFGSGRILVRSKLLRHGESITHTGRAK